MRFLNTLFNRSTNTNRCSLNKRSKTPSLEPLEQRIALDASGIRPQLEPVCEVYIDKSLVGVDPVVFGKSELVGQDTKSFVITGVVAGSTVEKWDATANQWRDVSTPPTTSNPRQLLQLLQNRIIQKDDQIRWLPKSTDGVTQKAFEIVGWDDGSPSVAPDPALLPGAVENLKVHSDADGELTVSWSQTASAAPTAHYIVSTDNGISQEITVTDSTTIELADLQSGDYTLTVSASNTHGEGDSSTASQSLLTFSDLVQDFQDSSLETGNSDFIRYGAHTPEGANAIDLYRIAVDVMKDLPSDNPYSWHVQAGIHGTFWTTLSSLKQGMIDEGFMTTAEADEAFSDWKVVLNNCNHWVKLWAQAQGVDPTIPTQNFSVVFIAWHRLYIAAFEKVIRQVLINEKTDNNSPFAAELSDADVETWALPYWDYRTPENSALPQGFREPMHNGRPNSLYEKIRGADINAGLPLSETHMPEGDLGIVPVPGNAQTGVSVSQYFNQSVALQQAQTLFTQFNSLAELSPHAVAHDVIGGMSDTALPRISNWIDMVDIARLENVPTLWESNTIPSDAGETLRSAIEQGSYVNVYEFIHDKYHTDPHAITSIIDDSNYLTTFFGESSNIAPSLIGWVPTAGRDSIFYLHHGYVDKLWTEYNTLPTSAYLQESVLDMAGWNFTFWEPDANGDPILQTYSTWNNATYLGSGVETITSNKVLQAVYYPNYTYDSVEPLNSKYLPLPKTSNSALALFENPIFSPSLNTIQPDADSSIPGEQNTIHDLAFHAVDLELPLTAGLINELTSTETDQEDIRVAIEMVLEAPMKSSENIGVAIGSKHFLETNADKIQEYWNSWDVTAGTGNRDGNFRPNETFRLMNLDNSLLSHNDSVNAMRNLQLARFNPLAMSSTSMPMTTHYSADVSFPTSQQFSFQHDIIREDSQLAIMILSATPDSDASQQTTLSEISSSLHQNITVGTIGGNVDALTYLQTNPAVIGNPAALANIQVWAETHSPDASTYYDRAIDLACVYMATNPDLIPVYRDNPLAAIKQYLDEGLFHGRSLDGWLRTSTIADARSLVFAGI